MVRATFAGFTTAISALQANQKRLDISGQNLSNMTMLQATSHGSGIRLIFVRE